MWSCKLRNIKLFLAPMISVCIEDVSYFNKRSKSSFSDWSIVEVELQRLPGQLEYCDWWIPIRPTNEAITYNTVTTSTLQKSNSCEKRKNTLPIRPRPHQAFSKESVFVSNKRKENIFCHTSVLFSSLLRTITCFYLQTRTFRCTCNYPQH